MFYNHCVVDGGWSSWVAGPCSKTCGGGKQRLTRRCNNPKPSCGGNKCLGLKIARNVCNTSCCPGKIIIIWSCLYQYNYMCIPAYIWFLEIFLVYLYVCGVRPR